ncbi:MAG TPA: hypothetical protein VKB26_10515, partial [Candidatus Acidoferrales bacterium]|nr:hypothetical protein [Candidatus Acidoferrales bacterium]
FRGSPVKRTKYLGLMRNACVALGNSSIDPKNPAYPRIIQRLEELASTEDAILAEHAAWALIRLRAHCKEQAAADQLHSFSQRGNQIPVALRDRVTDHAEEE